MRRYQVNKILNFPVPVSTRLPGLSGYVLVPTPFNVLVKCVIIAASGHLSQLLITELCYNWKADCRPKFKPRMVDMKTYLDISFSSLRGHVDVDDSIVF